MDEILNKLPLSMRNSIRSLPRQALFSLEEIRLRAGFPAMILAGGKEYLIGADATGRNGTVDKELINAVLNSIISYSMHAVQEELSNGFVTIKGGHRIGICGRAVLENGNIRAIKDISSLNIRCSRQIKGISDTFMQYIYKDKDRKDIYNTLIISPPRCGKTTLLRDMIRNVSNGGMRVGIVDERSEIAAMHDGTPQHDVGIRSDILDGCPKEKGMIIMIRSMAPDVMATDEIGKQADVYAIENAMCAGISILTTIHGTGFEDVLRSGIGGLIRKGIFKRLIYMSNSPKTGTVTHITDEENVNVF